MKYSTFFTAAAMASVASAHATLWQAVVDGVSGGADGRGVYIRAPKDNSPQKDLTSTNLRCNVGGGSAVPQTINAKPGSTIDLWWHHDTDGPSDDTIASSHKGPLITYLAPAASNGVGNVWIKIAQDGYSGGQWAVDKLIAAKGKHTITLPANLASGEYLLRDEILALHESDTAYTANPNRGVQLYMGCVQIKVSGSGATTLPAGVAFPGAYSNSDSGIVYNLYNADANTYKIPGPAVYNGQGGSAPSQPTTLVTTTRPATTQAPTTQAPTTQAPPAATTPPAAEPVTTTKKTKSACKPKTKTNSPPAATQPASSAAAAKWGQCGGKNWTGPTSCVSGTSCQKQNDYYSQCL